MSYKNYGDNLLNRFKSYREKYFSKQDELFHDDYNWVFKKKYANFNLFNPHQEILLPVDRRHRWFHSMISSQAFTVSVFGTIIQRDDLCLLNDIQDDSGEPLQVLRLDGKPEFDYPANTLNEPILTQVDLFILGIKGNVAIECKLTEQKVGSCAQVTKGECNGSYTEQTGRKPGERRYLIEIGGDYWKYIPELFSWRNDTDYIICMYLARIYQSLINELKK